MDGYITRNEHEEFCRRMESENSRLEDENNRQNKRITLLEETVRQINDLTISVKEMAVNMANMLEEQKKQGERLGTLEGVDGDMWKEVRKNILFTIIGIVLSYVFMKVGIST